jgi:hypothetical protein
MNRLEALLEAVRRARLRVNRMSFEGIFFATH